MRVAGNSVSNIPYHKNILQSKSQTEPNSFAPFLKKAGPAPESTQSESVSETSGTGPDQGSIWQELSERYNIRHATFNELQEISSQLYQAGQITLLDHAILTFDPSKSPMLKCDINLTPADQDSRRDWIAEYEARLRQDLKQNNVQAAANHQRIIGILNRLQRD